MFYWYHPLYKGGGRRLSDDSGLGEAFFRPVKYTWEGWGSLGARNIWEFPAGGDLG